MSCEIFAAQPEEDIEALVRLAGEYVQPTDELRPSVLEAARLAMEERRAQRQIARLAAIFLLATVFVASISGGQPTSTTNYANSWHGSIVAPVQAASENNRAGWEMVDSFTELRRQQARLLRPAL
jgi:hypothetical protein